MKILFRILLICWLVLIFYLSHQTGIESLESSVEVSEMVENTFNFENDLTHTVLRNFAHLVEYLILSILIFINIKISDSKTEYTLLLVFVVSVFDEIYQSFIPGRVMSGYDLLIDNIGSIIGYILISLLYRFKAGIQG